MYTAGVSIYVTDLVDEVSQLLRMIDELNLRIDRVSYSYVYDQLPPPL